MTRNKMVGNPVDPSQKFIEGTEPLRHEGIDRDWQRRSAAVEERKLLKDEIETLEESIIRQMIDLGVQVYGVGSVVLELDHRDETVLKAKKVS